MSLFKRYSFGDGWLDVHPRTPIKMHMLNNAIPQDSDDWSLIARDRFLVAEALIGGYHFDEDDAPLAYYYAHRDGLTPAQRYELFLSVADLETLNLLHDAWNETRIVENPIQYPDDIAEDDEQAKKNSSSNGLGQKSKPKKPQSGETASVTLPDKVTVSG